MIWRAKGSCRPGPGEPVAAEGGAPVGGGGDEAGALAPEAVAVEPLRDLVGPLEPHVVRGHRELHVVAEQRHQRGDVVALEGVDVLLEHRLLLGIDAGGVEVVDVALGRAWPVPAAARC